MPRHVILLTDAHEAPAYELIEALRLAGVTTLIEGLREAETEATPSPREVERYGELSISDPISRRSLCFMRWCAGADMVELQSAIEHAKTFWPGHAADRLSPPVERLSWTQSSQS